MKDHIEDFLREEELAAINTFEARVPTYWHFGESAPTKVLDYIFAPRQWTVKDLSYSWLQDGDVARLSDHVLIKTLLAPREPQEMFRHRVVRPHVTARRGFESHREELCFRASVDIGIEDTRPEEIAKSLHQHALPLLNPPSSAHRAHAKSKQLADLQHQYRRARGDRDERKRLKELMRPLVNADRRSEIEYTYANPRKRKKVNAKSLKICLLYTSPSPRDS